MVSRRIPLALTLGSALSLLGAEIFFRCLAQRRNQATFASAVARGFERRPSGRVAFIDVIRPNASDRIVYELRPDLRSVPFKGVPLSTNSLGFRSAELPPQRGADDLVIVGLGDSVMFGHGVADGEPYLSVLERNLNELRPERRWQVVNTAVPGYSTAIEVETLRTKALALHPDLVVIDFVPNDLELPVYLQAKEDVLDPSRSFLLDFARQALRGSSPAERSALVAASEELAAQTDPERADLDGFPARYRELIGWPAFGRALDELVRLRGERGFELVAFTLCEFADPVPAMLVEARARGIPTVSMQEQMQNWMLENHGQPLSADAHARSALAVEPNNPHPSALLHRMAAIRLQRWLEESGTMDRLLARRATGQLGSTPR